MTSPNTTAVPLSRIRRRHWKPPSQWTMVMTILMGDVLSFIANSVIRISRGDWGAAITIPIFILVYHILRYTKNHHESLEKDSEVIRLPPGMFLWALTGALTVLQVAVWVLLFSTGR